MRFSIITPSFRNSDWLKLCIASVADQQGVDFEHIVQDSCSDDGTQDWLPGDPRVKAFVEKDAGMYDAVNRGFRRATGDILAYLNCDEQLLPGALKAVGDFFSAHPEVDAVLPDTVIVDQDGNYVSHRYSLVPLRNHIWHRFPVLTCALFVRRRVVVETGIWLDTQWRDLGDVFWVMEMVNRGVRMAELRRFTSVFTETGDNMNFKPNAVREKQVKWEIMPQWIKRLAPAFLLYHKLRLLRSGMFFQRPFDYALYTRQSPGSRVTHSVKKPTARWRR